MVCRIKGCGDKCIDERFGEEFTSSMLKNTDEESEDSTHIPTFKGKQVRIPGRLMNTTKRELAKQLLAVGAVEVKWNTSLGGETNIAIKGRLFSEKLIDKAMLIKLKILSEAEAMKLLKNGDTDLSHTIKNDETKIVMSLIKGMKVKDPPKPLTLKFTRNDFLSVPSKVVFAFEVPTLLYAQVCAEPIATSTMASSQNHRHWLGRSSNRRRYITNMDSANMMALLIRTGTLD